MSDLLETIDGGVAVLTLNRPDRLNALSDDMVRGLIAALTRLGADPAVGCIVLTGAGRGFCAGGDVKRMAGAVETTMEERQEGLRGKHESVRLLRTIGKVVIAAVNGPAAGAGMGLALACDLRIAARSAKFRTAFAAVGFSGDFGGSWSLTRLVGTAKAREMYYLNTPVDAAEAERLGMVTRVVDDAVLMEETMTMARQIASGPTVAFSYMKRNLHAAETEPMQTVLDMEALGQARNYLTEDHREAAKAFVDKRPPVFKGR
ncbi:enoyl-CoA hydratase [Acidisphaera sp. L21]|uniref:enoyl-CoA hydratase n=1 Tax=Acidisphaera sp. L21 TaxID=1641851 RepID=UPI00131B4794|nr:enoyl-CoA hydratase [Acidisphaera sp. L21]